GETRPDIAEYLSQVDWIAAVTIRPDVYEARGRPSWRHRRRRCPERLHHPSAERGADCDQRAADQPYERALVGYHRDRHGDMQQSADHQRSPEHHGRRCNDASRVGRLEPHRITPKWRAHL